LAPDHLAPRHLLDVALLLLLRAVRHQRRAEHAVADAIDGRRNFELRLLLIEDDVLHAPEALAAVLLRPRQHGPAGVELGGLPALGPLDGALVLALAEQVGRRLVR